MNKYSKLLWALALAPAMVGCADDIDTTSGFEVEKPESLAQYEYLNSYGTLKSYLESASKASPDFKLGVALAADDYAKKGAVYMLANTNFMEMTAGNAMKYASIVGDDGSMNFGTVQQFIENAKNANMSIYGHTLCWHEQQNLTWLNSLLADKTVEIDPDKKNEVVDYEFDFSTQDSYNFWKEVGDATLSINKNEGCLQIDNPAAIDNWKVQYFVGDNFQLKEGESYILKATVRGTGEGEAAIGGNLGTWGKNTGIRINFSEDWEEKTCEFVSNTSDGGQHIMFQTGAFVGTVQIKNVKIVHLETPAVEYEVEVERRCIEVESDDKVEAAWDTQFWIMTDATFAEGDKWELTMNVRANYEATIGTQTHKGAGDYLHWSGCGTVKFTPKWTEYKASGTMDGSMAGGHSFAFNLNDFPAANKYYFDDISLKINGVEMIKNSSCDDDNMKDNYIAKEKRGGTVPARFVDKYIEIRSGNTIPLTPEEKAEILTKEMERWIKGMMEACDGYVKAWDVVNEAVSGGPWGQRYELQSATNAGDADKKFFWRDYLGDDFVRIPVKFARQYFEEFGGNPADLKLFINDYNLESDWDDNQKLKSLIEWIARWESDGETVIDGIGTQMHVTYYMNPETQKSKEEHVVKMLELLASTGKLIKISELDMGIADVDGNSIKTADVTFEQQKAMAEYYKFIVTKYFEIIPTAQQYGITQWCITDSPDGSGWRAGEPVGLWDINYARKPAYGGFCDALSQQ